MGINSEPLAADLFSGKVSSVDSSNRTIDVEYLNMGVTKKSVIVINPPGDYSLPEVGSSGLVVGSDVQGYYFLGKIDFGYARKIAGLLDSSTGKKYKIRRVVEGGEGYYANPTIGSWLHLANTGNMSLMHPSGDGLKYTRSRLGSPLRLLQMGARTIHQKATTTSVSFGSILRSIPSLGYTLVKDITGFSGQEFNVDISIGAVPMVKFILGNVVSALGVNEMSAFGKRVFALLKTGLTPVTEANVKIDELGNVEVNAAPTAQMALTGLLINLGKTVAPEPVIKGLTFQGLENTLRGAEQTFLTAESTFLGLLAVYYGAVVTAAGTATATPGDPIKNTTAIGALGTAATPVLGGITAYIAATTAYNAAVTSYLSALTTALSTVVKTA